MSLLNEALRKNKTEKTRKINFSSQDDPGSKWKTLIIFILSAVVIGGFIFVWIYFAGDSGESLVINSETLVDATSTEGLPSESVASEQMVPEPTVFDPMAGEATVSESEIPDETARTRTGNAVLPEEKSDNKVSVKIPEQVRIPSISKVSEEKKKTRKAKHLKSQKQKYQI